MNTYRNLDFISDRKRALDRLSQLYSTHKNSASTDSAIQEDSWLVELEVLVHGKTLCLTITVYLKPDFPLSLPSIYLSTDDIAKLGPLPNIDTHGLICIFDSNTNVPNPQEPEKLIEVCVQQAKKIIEEGFNSNNLEKYNQEFIAYWENKYNDEEPVDTSILSLIHDTGKPPNLVKYVALKSAIGNFHALVYSEEEQFSEFKNYLYTHQIGYHEIPTFYLGELDIWPPPYHFSNHDAINLIQSAHLENEFMEHLKSGPLLPIVTFARVINGRILVFGWSHKPIEYKIRHRRGRIVKREESLPKKQYHKLLDHENASILVNRFSPQVYSLDRLTQRTSADYDQYESKGMMRVLVAGLGSIGSNLIPFLEKSGIVEYRFVDDDSLSLDNLGRHFLGINYVGRKKTEAMRSYLEKKNPLITVHTREKRIVPLIREEPIFLSPCDCYFFCTGDINSEMWLAQNISQSEWNRPAFFIWVEPYLAGGHCIYFNGIDPITWETLFPNNRFIYNCRFNSQVQL